MKPIPIDETMPEDGQFFLACGPALGQCSGGPNVEIYRRHDGAYWCEGGTEWCSVEQSPNFTHWLPLPSFDLTP